MKNSKITVLFDLLLLINYAHGEDCESIPLAKTALNTCATPDQQERKEILLPNSCIAACLAAEWGFLDENERLSLDKINQVFHKNIKDENLKKQLSEIHEKCVKQGLQETEKCKMGAAYNQCLGSDKDMKELVNAKYCAETAEAHLVLWE